ncbi:transposase [Virgibacillus sp. FSP13]
MSKKRRRYSSAEKAKVVLEILREESTLNEIAQKYEVSPQLISRWRTEFLNNMPAFLKGRFIPHLLIGFYPLHSLRRGSFRPKR